MTILFHLFVKYECKYTNKWGIMSNFAQKM